MATHYFYNKKVNNTRNRNFTLTQTHSVVTESLKGLEQNLCPCLPVTLSERLYSDTDRHYYTLSCFHSLSMKCHSIFNVLSLCLGSIALQLFRLCSVTLLHSPFCPYLSSFLCPLISHPHCYTLTIFLPCLSLSPFYNPCLFALLSSSWYAVQMPAQVSCFYWLCECLVFITSIKTSRSWARTACTFELMMSFR